MDGLTVFGLVAVTAMVVCYALEARNPLFVLGFAGACALASVYGPSGGLAVRRGRSHLDCDRPGTLADPPRCPLTEDAHAQRQHQQRHEGRDEGPRRAPGLDAAD